MKKYQQEILNKLSRLNKSEKIILWPRCTGKWVSDEQLKLREDFIRKLLCKK